MSVLDWGIGHSGECGDQVKSKWRVAGSVESVLIGEWSSGAREMSGLVCGGVGSVWWRGEESNRRGGSGSACGCV
jgi:hypothetical protein